MKMHRPLRLTCVIGTVLCVGGTLAACGSGSSTGSKASGQSSGATQPLTSVTLIQSSGNLPYAASNIADVEGFFKQHGLNVKITYGKGDTATDPAVMTGGAQFGIGTTPPLFKYYVAGEKPLMVAAATDQLTQQYIINSKKAQSLGISPSDSQAEKFKKIGGAHLTIGTLDIGGTLQLNFNGMAAENGLNPKTAYTFTSIPSYPALLTSLQSGRIDLATVAVPYGTQAVAAGYADMFVNAWAGEDKQYDGATYAALFTSQSYANAHPAVVKEMHDAIDEALKFIHSNPSKAVTDLMPTYGGAGQSILSELLVTDKAGGFADSAEIPQSGFEKARLAAVNTVDPKASTVTYSELVYSAARAN